MKYTAFPLALALPALAFAQTATPAKKPIAHRARTTASTSSTALPANIPKVAGIDKTLYALKYIDITRGTGAVAEPTVLGASQADSKVMFYTVKYTGWLAKDGTQFDSSFDHPGAEPLTLPIGVHRVIPGWDTGFTGMHIGGKRRLFIPYQLAYGDAGKPPVIPAKADLIFDVELVSVSDKPPTPKALPARPTGTAPTPPPASAAPANQANPAPPPSAASKPIPMPDPTKPMTDPATNNPAKATTPDNATKPAPKPSTNPPGR